MKEEKLFIHSTALLMFSSGIVKVLSALYRIAATRAVGAAGMGQYSAVFSVFMPFYAFATAGITPAISRICASQNPKDRQAISSIKKSASVYFGLFSRAMTAMAITTAYLYGNFTDNMLIPVGVALLSPNLMFATFEAIYKGISQGTLHMQVTARANILESTAKIIVLFCLLYIFKYKDNQVIILFATVSIAGLVCLIYMGIEFKITHSGVQYAKLLSPGRLFSVSMPVSASALVVTVINFFDTVVCLPVIRKFSDDVLVRSYPFISFSAQTDKTMWLYGVYQGLCLAVVNIIPSFSASIGASTLPLITQSIAGNDNDKTIHLITRLIKFTAFLVVPVSLFVATFSDDIIALLYGNRGAQSTLGGYMLGIMAPIAILSAFSFPLNSILHAYNKSGIILKILLVSGAIKMSASYWMCSHPEINVMGLMYSQMISNFVVFILSAISVEKIDSKIHVIRHIVLPFCISYVIITLLKLMASYIADLNVLIKLSVNLVLFAIPYLLCITFADFLVECK